MEMEFTKGLLQREEGFGALSVAVGSKIAGWPDLAIEQGVDVARIKHEAIVRRRRVVVAADRAARIRRDNTGFPYTQIVDVENRLKLDRPFSRLERGFTFEQLYSKSDVVLQGDLLALAIKLISTGNRSADPARCRQTPKLQFGLGRCGEVQKNILADDWHITLKQALLVRVPQERVRAFVRLLCDATGVTLPW